MNKDEFPTVKGPVEEVIDQSLYRGFLRFVAICFFISSIVYSLEYKSSKYGDFFDKLRVTEDIEYSIFAIVLSVVGIGLLLLSNLIEDIKKTDERVN